MSAGTVLITGYNGFTGKYAAELLRERGFKAVGLVHEKGSGTDEYSCDLTDKARVLECVQAIKPQYVLHLAALAFVGHSDEKEFYNVNVFGTLNLLDALYASRVEPEKVLIASSANIYGTPANIETIDESVNPSPVNHYAMSKLAMEYMTRTWFEKLPIVIVRPFNYTGAGQDERFLVPKIVNHFKRREEVIELGNLDVFRDFSDVRDVVRAYGDLLVSRAESEVFNVCSGRAYALREVIDWAGEIAGYKIEVRTNPAFVRSNEIPRLKGDNSKLVKYISYQPMYSFADTIRSMFE